MAAWRREQAELDGCEDDSSRDDFADAPIIGALVMASDGTLEIRSWDASAIIKAASWLHRFYSEENQPLGQRLRRMC